MKITQKLLKRVFYCEKYAHFMPNEVQIDLICTWFPELTCAQNSLKKGWISELKEKEFSKDQYKKLIKAKRKSPEDSKSKLLKLAWKQVETAQKIYEENYKTPFPQVPASFLRKIFSLKGVYIVDVSMNKSSPWVYNTSVLFFYVGKAFQAEFVITQELSSNERKYNIFLWPQQNEKIDCTGEDIKLCVERYIANGRFNKLKSDSLKINNVYKLAIQEKWRPRYTRIEKIFIGKSNKKIQPPIVLINKRRKPIAVMVPGDNCELCLKIAKYYAEELQINYAFSTDLKVYMFFDFTKNKQTEDDFEKLPIFTWIQNWDKGYKEKLSQKNKPAKPKIHLDELPLEEVLKLLDSKNKGRAKYGLPPLTLKEYLEKKGY